MGSGAGRRSRPLPTMRFSNNNSKMNERQTSVRRQAGEADPAHHASLNSNLKENERRNSVRRVQGGVSPILPVIPILAQPSWNRNKVGIGTKDNMKESERPNSVRGVQGGVSPILPVIPILAQPSWNRNKMERETRFEPATLSLEG